MHEMPKEMTIGECADYFLANGGIALHCKVGDVVYQTDGVNIYENEVCEISLSKRAVIYYTENAVAFDETALGKSIFLTKQEAERALKDCEPICDYTKTDWNDCCECSARDYCDKYNERSEIIGELLGEVIGEIKNEGR